MLAAFLILFDYVFRHNIENFDYICKSMLKNDCDFRIYFR